MNPSPPLILIGKEECWLCEQAKELLFRADIAFTEQSILGDLTLRQRYGLRVPVLLNRVSGQELDWPFDAALARLLAT